MAIVYHALRVCPVVFHPQAEKRPAARNPLLSGGSLLDYVFTKLLGVPAFVTPYANADEANHAPNENLELERFYKCLSVNSKRVDKVT